MSSWLIFCYLPSFTARDRSLWTGNNGASRLRKTRFHLVKHYQWFSCWVLILWKLITVLSESKIVLPSPRGYRSIFAKRSYPLARRESPAEGRRPEGEGANIDRRLVPYHAKSMRIQSRSEFIYVYIYMHQRPSFLRWRSKVGYWVNVWGKQ